jgi:hypothetical protein
VGVGDVLGSLIATCKTYDTGFSVPSVDFSAARIECVLLYNRTFQEYVPF